MLPDCKYQPPATIQSPTVDAFEGTHHAHQTSPPRAKWLEEIPLLCLEAVSGNMLMQLVDCLLSVPASQDTGFAQFTPSTTASSLNFPSFRTAMRCRKHPALEPKPLKG